MKVSEVTKLQPNALGPNKNDKNKNKNNLFYVVGL